MKRLKNALSDAMLFNFILSIVLIPLSFFDHDLMFVLRLFFIIIIPVFIAMDFLFKDN